jgi:hypothetical protein
MTKKKTKPLKGEYRTLSVPVDRDAESGQPAAVPDEISRQMHALELPNLNEDADARRREAALPETDGQQRLVDFFDGAAEYTPDLVDIYLAETHAAEPNDQLFLKYHHRGSHQLADLLEACLERYPDDRDLLYDLAYLNRFVNRHDTIIGFYCRALAAETRMDQARAIAEDLCAHELFFSDEARARLEKGLAGHPERWKLVEAMMERFA